MAEVIRNNPDIRNAAGLVWQHSLNKLDTFESSEQRQTAQVIALLKHVDLYSHNPISGRSWRNSLASAEQTQDIM
jgi:hypothetical protein